MPSYEDKKRVLMYGRFQPFHKGHLEAIKWLLGRFNEVVIMIGMADESHTWRNPFTSGERLLMIREALRVEGIPCTRYITATIRTLNIYTGNAGYVLNYIPPVQAVATANPQVSRAFLDAGVKTVTPPLVNRRMWSGEYIRRLIVEDNPEWKKLVPKPVDEIIEMIDGINRLKAIKPRL